MKERKKNIVIFLIRDCEFRYVIMKIIGWNMYEIISMKTTSQMIVLVLVLWKSSNYKCNITAIRNNDIRWYECIIYVKTKYFYLGRDVYI